MCANEEKNKRDRKLEQAKVMGLGELVLVIIPECRLALGWIK